MPKYRGTTCYLRDLPIGSIVKINEWRTDTGPDQGWVVVANNHPGYPEDSVTLCSTSFLHYPGKLAAELRTTNNPYKRSMINGILNHMTVCGANMYTDESTDFVGSLQFNYEGNSTFMYTYQNKDTNMRQVYRFDMRTISDDPLGSDISPFIPLPMRTTLNIRDERMMVQKFTTNFFIPSEMEYTGKYTGSDGLSYPWEFSFQSPSTRNTALYNTGSFANSTIVGKTSVMAFRCEEYMSNGVGLSAHAIKVVDGSTHISDVPMHVPMAIRPVANVSGGLIVSPTTGSNTYVVCGCDSGVIEGKIIDTRAEIGGFTEIVENITLTLILGIANGVPRSRQAIGSGLDKSSYFFDAVYLNGKRIPLNASTIVNEKHNHNSGSKPKTGRESRIIEGYFTETHTIKNVELSPVELSSRIEVRFSAGGEILKSVDYLDLRKFYSEILPDKNPKSPSDNHTIEIRDLIDSSDGSYIRPITHIDNIIENAEIMTPVSNILYGDTIPDRKITFSSGNKKVFIAPHPGYDDIVLMDNRILDNYSGKVIGTVPIERYAIVDYAFNPLGAAVGYIYRHWKSANPDPLSTQFEYRVSVLDTNRLLKNSERHLEGRELPGITETQLNISAAPNISFNRVTNSITRSFVVSCLNNNATAIQAYIVPPTGTITRFTITLPHGHVNSVVGHKVWVHDYFKGFFVQLWCSTGNAALAPYKRTIVKNYYVKSNGSGGDANATYDLNNSNVAIDIGQYFSGNVEFRTSDGPPFAAFDSDEILLTLDTNYPGTYFREWNYQIFKLFSSGSKKELDTSRPNSRKSGSLPAYGTYYIGDGTTQSIRHMVPPTFQQNRFYALPYPNDGVVLNAEFITSIEENDSLYSKDIYYKSDFFIPIRNVGLGKAGWHLSVADKGMILRRQNHETDRTLLLDDINMAVIGISSHAEKSMKKKKIYLYNQGFTVEDYYVSSNYSTSHSAQENTRYIKRYYTTNPNDRPVNLSLFLDRTDAEFGEVRLKIFNPLITRNCNCIVTITPGSDFLIKNELKKIEILDRITEHDGYCMIYIDPKNNRGSTLDSIMKTILTQLQFDIVVEYHN